MNPARTLEWDDGTIVTIDQVLLPHEESWLRTSSPVPRELLVGIFARLAKQESFRAARHQGRH